MSVIILSYDERNKSELYVVAMFTEQPNSNQTNKLPCTTPFMTDINIWAESSFHPTLFNNVVIYWSHFILLQ